jgi:hypothetical protein
MPILKAVADEDYTRSPAMAALRLVGVPLLHWASLLATAAYLTAWAVTATGALVIHYLWRRAHSPRVVRLLDAAVLRTFG